MYPYCTGRTFSDGWQWVVAHSSDFTAWQTLISFGICLSAAIFATRLPKYIKPRLESYLTAKIENSGRVVVSLAQALAVKSADFISSVGTLIGLAASIFIEMWKLIRQFPEAASVALIVFGVAVSVATFAIVRVDWISQSRTDYEAKTSLWLQGGIYVLFTVLFVTSNIGHWLEPPQATPPTPIIICNCVMPPPAGAHTVPAVSAPTVKLSAKPHP